MRVETSTGVSGQAVGQTHQQQVIQANGIRMNSMTLGEYVCVNQDDVPSSLVREDKLLTIHTLFYLSSNP